MVQNHSNEHKVISEKTLQNKSAETLPQIVTPKKVGRPKGARSREAILQEKTKRAFNMRVFQMADKLLNAQAVVALGTYKMIVKTINPDKSISIETVRDEKRMQKMLDTGVYGRDYLIVAGQEPDWKAANALLDRVYGKAKETVDLGVNVKFSLKELADRARELRKQNMIEGDVISVSAPEPADETEPLAENLGS